MSESPIQPMQNEISTPSATNRLSVELPFSFTGSGLDYFLLVFKTMLLTLITAGLYYPWARAQRINYFYRNTRIGTHNLAFFGTGKEMAIGYVKGLAIYGVLYGISLYLQSLSKTLPWLFVFGTLVTMIIFYALFPLVIWGGRAYRASRTSYRGIRFRMDNTQLKSFVLKTSLDLFLVLVTFGLYLPYQSYNLTKRLIDASFWGREGFRFEDCKIESVKLSISNFFITLFSLGLLFPVTIIRRANFNYSKIRFQDMRLVSELKWIDGYKLVLFPLVISTLSLGLLFPWATVWSTKLFYSKIFAEGDIDWSRIVPTQANGTALGETASSMLDIDTGLGFG